MCFLSFYLRCKLSVIDLLSSSSNHSISRIFLNVIIENHSSFCVSLLRSFLSRFLFFRMWEFWMDGQSSTATPLTADSGATFVTVSGDGGAGFQRAKNGDLLFSLLNSDGWMNRSIHFVVVREANN